MNRVKTRVSIYILAVLLFSIQSIACDAQNTFVNKSYTFVVTSTIKKTEIKITEGDEVRIKASGNMVLHGFTGSVAPDGIDGFKNHRMDPVFAYGALLYKVGDDDWNIVDPEDTIVAERTGFLKFMVNDNDPSNNTGKFTVKVTVKSLKVARPQKIAKSGESKNTSETTPKHLSEGTLTLTELQNATGDNSGEVTNFLLSKQFRFDDESNDKMHKYSFNKDNVNAAIVKDVKEHQTTFITSSTNNYKQIKASLDDFGYKQRKVEKKVDGVFKYANSKYSLSIVQVTLNNKPQYFFTIKKL